MKRQPRVLTLLAAVSLIPAAAPASAAALDRVRTENGVVVGAPPEDGVRAFRGVPFAAPPTGDLRFRPPQPAKNWSGDRSAAKFGPRCMQRALFGDMGFRSDGMSEDCLHLNVWTPAKSATDRLPVLVYFYGGGFGAGDGSEPRYDGAAIARTGVVALTVNYRLTVFGFFSHPELTKESKRNASGNQGLLDQAAAIAWARRNIAAFGGDPRRITIAGESAGSISVSAHMASPLSRDLIAGAIGESGGLTNPGAPPLPLDKAEANGVTFGAAIGAPDLKALRAMKAEDLLESTAKPNLPRFGPIVDGYFLTKAPHDVFAAGEQAQVPLLAGWNSEENNYRTIVGGANEPTPENYAKAVGSLYGDRASEILRAYPGWTKEEVIQNGTDLAGDRFIAYGTWKWCDLQARTSTKPVYRYYYTRPRPAMNPEMGDAVAGLAGGVIRSNAAAAAPRPPARGAVHSAEIEYAMGNLATNKTYAWTSDDHKVSALMLQYFANFVKTGDPNRPGLPAWPAINRGESPQFLRIDVDTRAVAVTQRGRYLLLDEIATKK
jgi:para-nitrobenzyl esterase